MSEAILFPLHKSERDEDERKHAGNPVLLETLRHAWATQMSLDADISAWDKPVTGPAREIIEWLHARNAGKNATPYDYRKFVRGYAAQLLFKATDGLPHRVASRPLVQDRWTAEEEREYWFCVAICSAAWIEV